MKTDYCEFCTRCFASDQDSSWGGVATNNYCSNCGSGGTTIRIQEWAIEDIRSNASWVGKRYYTNSEDIETQKEIKRLRSTISIFNGRSAKPTINDPLTWEVSQKLEDGNLIIVFVSAASEQAALEKAKTLLPFIS